MLPVPSVVAVGTAATTMISGSPSTGRPIYDVFANKIQIKRGGGKGSTHFTFSEPVMVKVRISDVKFVNNTSIVSGGCGGTVNVAEFQTVTAKKGISPVAHTAIYSSDMGGYFDDTDNTVKTKTCTNDPDAIPPSAGDNTTPQAAVGLQFDNLITELTISLADPTPSYNSADFVVISLELICTAKALPINPHSFTGNLGADKKPLLKCETYQEQDNTRSEIQKSMDVTNFVTIAVKEQGNSATWGIRAYI